MKTFFSVNLYFYNNNNNNGYLLSLYIFFSYLFSGNERRDLNFTGKNSIVLFIIIIIKNTKVLKTIRSNVRQGIRHLI